MVCLAVTLGSTLTAQSGQSASNAVIVNVQPTHNLTDDGAWLDNWAAFSPDGQEVVFTRAPANAAHRARLWRMSVSGGAAAPVTPTDFDRHIAATPAQPPPAHDRTFFRRVDGHEASLVIVVRAPDPACHIDWLTASVSPVEHMRARSAPAQNSQRANVGAVTHGTSLDRS